MHTWVFIRHYNQENYYFSIIFIKIGDSLLGPAAVGDFWSLDGVGEAAAGALPRMQYTKYQL